MKELTTRTVAEVAGIIALLASLVFLAMEIKQSNSIAVASIQYSIISDYNEYHRQVLSDPEMAEFVARMEVDDSTAFSPADEMRAHSFATQFINLWFVIQTAYDNGQLPEENFRAYVEDAAHMLRRYPRAVPYFKASILSTPSLHHLAIFQPIFQANDNSAH